jgi:hypothetical protein
MLLDADQLDQDLASSLVTHSSRGNVMARNNGRTVYLRSDGRWANKANDALKASGFHAAMEVACQEAARMLAADGGGELTVKSEAGVIERRTIPAA